MFTFVITLIIIVSLLLILVVLAQNSKGGGLSSSFGGSGQSSQMMGVKSTTDIMEKITWGLAIALLGLTLSTNFMIQPQATQPGMSSPNVEEAQENNAMPGLNAPAPQQQGQGGGNATPGAQGTGGSSGDTSSLDLNQIPGGEQ